MTTSADPQPDAKHDVPDDKGSPVDTLRRKLSRTMLTTVVDHNLIQDGDRILVALSGGKDSYTMLDLLWRARTRAPVQFDLVAFHLDQVQPGYDGASLAAWLDAHGAPYKIHREDTYSTVLDVVGDSRTRYCAPCSRFRRGILYTWAERLNCNKLALGHHREDTLETFLMNLCYNGKLQSMPPRFRADCGIDVIRPLIHCAEEDIACYAREVGFPIIPCNLCGSLTGGTRKKARSWIEQLEQERPELRTTMLAALRHVSPTHLHDRELAEVWEEREATQRAAAGADPQDSCD